MTSMEGPEEAALRRLEVLGSALDQALLHAPPPTPEQVEEEITGLVAEAPDLGEDPRQTETQLRGLSYAFWRDWFAVDSMIKPLAMAEEEVWNLCLAREAARTPQVYGAQA